ncbi:MAG: CAP domain-containing protein [Anaerovoracaceae bacterium]|jgi:uncharacterized YkwD family protein
MKKRIQYVAALCILSIMMLPLTSYAIEKQSFGSINQDGVKISVERLQNFCCQFKDSLKGNTLFSKDSLKSLCNTKTNKECKSVKECKKECGSVKECKSDCIKNLNKINNKVTKVTSKCKAKVNKCTNSKCKTATKVNNKTNNKTINNKTTAKVKVNNKTNTNIVNKTNTSPVKNTTANNSKKSDTYTDNNANVNKNPVVTAPDNNAGSYEKQVVDLVNKERAAQGLPALSYNASLSKVAEAKAADMRDKGYFSHTSPTYGSPFDMMKTFGITYRAAGENIAKGYKTPDSVMNGWMNSPGHRANILNSDFSEIGVGYVTDSNGTGYWVQMFIHP